MNPIKLYLKLFLLLCTTSLVAQNPITMRSNAMGGVGIGFQDINSIFHNPAGLIALEGTSGLLSAERRFNLAALNTYSLGMAIPTEAGTVGVSVNYFGFEGFNQQKYGLVYARKLLKNFSVGAEINYQNFQIPEYGSTNTLSFQLGFQYDLSKTLVVGGKLANPIQRELANGEHLPTEIQFGMAYKAAKKVLLALDVEKQIDFDTNVKAGLEYELAEILYLRLGVATNPSLLSFGLGLKLENGLKFDIASSFHQTLGWTPGMSLIYQGQQNNKRK